jgi:Family of unknown function (DUF6527)
MAKLYKMAEGLLVFFCPGCGFDHPYHVPPQRREPREGGIPAPLWQWNGSMDRPTFSPSLLVNGHDPEKRCHLFITDGMIQYLGDCFHDLKNKTIPIPDYED